MGLSSKYVRSRTYLKSLVYFPTMLSAVAVGITFTALMHPTTGLFNQVLRLFGSDGVKWLTDSDIALYSVMFVDFWKGVGTSTVIYLAGLGAIPKDYYEAADLDGAGPIQRFFRVTLPLMVPSINSVLTLSLIGGLKSYELLWTMTEGGPGYSTEILGTVTYKLFAHGNYFTAPPLSTFAAAADEAKGGCKHPQGLRCGSVETCRKADGRPAAARPANAEARRSGPMLWQLSP